MARLGELLVQNNVITAVQLTQAQDTQKKDGGRLGTALTKPQVAQLSAIVNTVVLALDADAAGQKAMLRAQEVAAGRQIRILVAAMPEGVDPAEMVIEEGGAERFRALVEEAVDLAEFQIDLILAGVDMNSPRDRDRGLAEAAPVLAKVSPGATRQELTRRVGERLQIDSSVVLDRVGVEEKQAALAVPDRPAGSIGGSMAAGIVYSVDHVYKHVLQEHQRTRIDVLLGKETDLKGAGYNVNQSKIAIGSGGPYAQAAAKALLEHSDLGAREIVEKALKIAGDICIYTNHNITIETL